MNIVQGTWSPGGSWAETLAGDLQGEAQLVLVFGDRRLLEEGAWLDAVRARHPSAAIASCSTAGEIHGPQVSDGSIVVTAVTFDQTRVVPAAIDLAEGEDAEAAGRRLAAAFEREGLRHLFVLSDGLQVNGTSLIRGLGEVLPTEVSVTGGLSGDADRFERTVVGLDTIPAPGRVVAIGLYGERLRVAFGSLGGWDPFGPERRITRSKDNVLYELDGRSALELYREYLGDYASELPASGLLFPLSIRLPDGGEDGIVRTILSIDEAEQSMTFAGDMPEGAHARLMKANFDRLVDGAHGAAQATYERLGAGEPELAILISCVGRKMVLKQRIEEEVESVRAVLGAGTVLAGFYSYGEISPVVATARCELHNQTMTITAFSER